MASMYVSFCIVLVAMQDVEISVKKCFETNKLQSSCLMLYSS